MAKEFAKGFYASSIWHKTKNAYLKNKHFLCERCFKKGKFSKANIVHHRTWLNENNIDDTNYSLNFENLEALCQTCHNKEHMETSKKYIFDENGNLLPPIA